MKTKKVIFGIILLVVLGWSINYFFNYSIKKSELTEISGFLQNIPKFDKGKGGAYMELDLVSDQYRYQTDRLSYNALDIEGVKSELIKNRKVEILISKNNGFEEILNLFVGIKRIYVLKSNNKTFLDLNDYNKEKKQTKYLPLILWFIFLVIYIHCFWVKKNAL